MSQMPILPPGSPREAAAPLRLLVIDDDADMRAMLEEALTGSGFVVDLAGSAAEMREAMARHEPALVLLDLKLRHEDGFVVARQLRERSGVPIVMISGSSSEADRVLLLEVAADDFLVKPFSMRELVARVRAVLRRYGRGEGPAPVAAPANAAAVTALRTDRVRFGDWLLDFGDRELRSIDGRACPLTHGEFRLLEIFVRHPRRVWKRDELLEQTRSAETDVYDRTIDVLILRLRRKIEPNPKQPQFIFTERGLGYVFNTDVTSA